MKVINRTEVYQELSIARRRSLPRVEIVMILSSLAITADFIFGGSTRHLTIPEIEKSLVYNGITGWTMMTE